MGVPGPWTICRAACVQMAGEGRVSRRRGCWLDRRWAEQLGGEARWQEGGRAVCRQ